MKKRRKNNDDSTENRNSDDEQEEIRRKRGEVKQRMIRRKIQGRSAGEKPKHKL